jgi:hypothetical protein
MTVSCLTVRRADLIRKPLDVNPQAVRRHLLEFVGFEKGSVVINIAVIIFIIILCPSNVGAGPS